MRVPFSWFLATAMLVSACARADELDFVTEEFFPFSYSVVDPATGSSRAAGPFVELVELVCKRIHSQCTVNVYPWRRALILAEKGEVDGIFTVIRSPRREHAFHITPMLVRSRYGVYSRRSSSASYSRAQDMAGKTIGVYGPSGTSYLLSRHLESVAGAKMHLATDNLQLLRMLESGRFGKDGLVVINQDVARNLIATEQLEVREAGQLQPIEYGIGFSRKAVSEARFMRFRSALAGVIEDGSAGAILKRYGLDPAY